MASAFPVACCGVSEQIKGSNLRLTLIALYVWVKRRLDPKCSKVSAPSEAWCIFQGESPCRVRYSKSRELSRYIY